MNKKGFTLIEIIICISLIIIISTSTFVAIKLNNSKNDIENINNTIKNALDVYLNVYKDSDGDKYIDGINNGGKGLYIGLKTLVNVGLLEQDIITTLEKEYNKQEKDLKIFVSNSINTNDDILCGNNLIEYTFSWDTDTTSPMYLCPKKTDTTSIDNENNSISVLNENMYLAQGANPNNWLEFEELVKKIHYYRKNNNWDYQTDKIKFRILSIKDNKLTAIVGDVVSIKNVSTGNYYDTSCKSTGANINNNLSANERSNRVGQCLAFRVNNENECFETFNKIEILYYIAGSMTNSTRTLISNTNINLRIIKYNEFIQTFDDNGSWLPSCFFYGNSTYDVAGLSGNSNVYYNMTYNGCSDNYIYPVFTLNLNDKVKVVNSDCDETAGSYDCPYKIEIKDNYCGLE